MSAVILSSSNPQEYERPDLTVREAAHELHVGREKVSQLIHSGQLKAWELNPSARRKTYRIRREDLDDLRKRQAAVPAPKLERHRPYKPKRDWF